MISCDKKLFCSTILVTALCTASLTHAQVIKGHSSKSSASKERSCEAAKSEAEYGAESQVKWHKRNNGVAYSAEYFDLDSGGNCSNCTEGKIYGNPTQYACTIRWRLVKE